MISYFQLEAPLAHPALNIEDDQPADVIMRRDHSSSERTMTPDGQSILPLDASAAIRELKVGLQFRQEALHGRLNFAPPLLSIYIELVRVCSFRLQLQLERWVLPKEFYWQISRSNDALTKQLIPKKGYNCSGSRYWYARQGAGGLCR